MSFSYVIEEGYAMNTTSEDCYWCNDGECTEQTGGTGWEICKDASPGGTQCGFGGDDCYVGSPE